MIKEQGLRVSQVCEDMNLGESAIHRWVKQVDDELTGDRGIGKPLTAEQQRIRELEKELKITLGNNDMWTKRPHQCPRTEVNYRLVQQLQR
jgi:transposase